MAWEKLTRRYVEMRVWKLLERIDFWRQLWLFGLWQMGAWDSASQWATEEIGNLSEIIGMKESDVSWRKSNCDSLCFNERVVNPLPLMTYGLKLSLKAWILKFKKKSFNNLRFNELQLNFGNSNFFAKLRYVKYILTNSRFRCKL